MCYAADTLCLYWVCLETIQILVTLKPRYVIEPETFKYSSILRGYNKWYIAKLNLKKETTNPNKIQIKDELVLQGMTQAAVDEI